MNPERLSQCYDAYCDKLALYARNWLPQDSAQDVVQAAFVRLMSQRSVPDDVQAWLFRTVRNGAITRLRRRAVRMRHARRIASHTSPWFESRSNDLIDARKAEEILQTLPAEQREVVLLRIWGQLSFRQIGQVVGGSLTTIHSRYKAALAVIKKRMQDSCETKTE